MRMECVLFSIKPNYVDLIFNGIKKYEYRKSKIKDSINRLIIYSTYPTKEVVGEATIKRIIQGPPEYVWTQTYSYSGVDKNFFDRYYYQRNKAIAYELKDVIRYDSPLKLSDIGLDHAPQSYMYIELSL